MADSWRVTLPCSRMDAERLKDDIGPLALLDSPPVLMTSEPDPARPDEWQLDAYFEGKPTRKVLAQLATLLDIPATGLVVEKLPDEDWVTLSQAGLEPITEGRFHIHTSVRADRVPEGSIAFEIDAGRAFGTGQHATTAGCLAMLDRLAAGGATYRNILDLGTGTGVLAFAAARVFQGRAIATDIDPVSIEVAAENARRNDMGTSRLRGDVELAVANGMNHRRIRQRAPFDLIIANILAGPLIDMAKAISAGLRPGGTLILAGLLDHQQHDVAAAYARHGCRLVDSIVRDDWPTLRLRKKLI